VASAALVVSLVVAAARAQESCLDIDVVNLPQPALGDHIGPVALDGLRLVVGVPGRNAVGSSSGAVAIFEHSGPGAAWSLVQELVASNGGPNEDFGHAVALSGDVFAVGAFRHDHLGVEQAGVVYVFERQPGGAWLEVARLGRSQPQIYDWFGRSLDLDEGRLVVGAPYADPGVNAGGVATVFERANDGTWSEVAELVAPLPLPKLNFGVAVAIDGDTLVVGAPNAATPFVGAGAAHVFERASNGAWSHAQALAPSSAGTQARFGEDVDVSADAVVVGAPGLSSIFGADGAAFVFERTAGAPFTESQLLLHPSNDGGARFGTQVALEADRLAIGAPLALDPATLDVVGAVLTYGRGALGFQPLESVFGTWTSGRFGNHVSVELDEVAAGAPFADAPAVDSGVAQSFRVVALPPDVLLVDASATGLDCTDPWDLAHPTLAAAIDAAIADPTKREIRVAAGAYRLTPTNDALDLPSGLCILGGFPVGGGELAERDPVLHPTVLLRNEPDAPPLTARYFSNINLSGTPVLVQNVSNIDNFWGPGSPITQVDNFSVRWEGFVTAPTTSPVAFHTTTDDGVRLWVNNVLVIDKWIDQSATEHTGNINLTGGVPVPIRMEFYEKGGDAVAKLAWTLLGVPKEIIPSSAFSSGAASRVLVLDSGTLELDGFVIENSAVAPSDADPTGGALRLSNGAQLVLRNCTLRGNTSTSSGGALRADTAARVVLIDCLVANNTASGAGGAISITGAGTRLDAVGTRFVGNVSQTSGGALHVIGGATAIVANCVFDANSAGTAATPTQEGGAAIVLGAGSLLEIDSSTIVNNVAPGGSDLCGGVDARTTATLRVHNSILWNNRGAASTASANQVRATSAACVELDTCIVHGWTGAVVNSTCGAIGAFDAFPFLTLDNALALGSPAIDVGNTALLPLDTFDLDDDGDVLELLPLDAAHKARVHDDVLTPSLGGARTDIGAYERGAPPSAEPIDCLNNPAGSLAVTSGSTALGDQLELTLTDPVQSLPAGTYPILVFSPTLANPAAPCSQLLAGAGLAGPTAPGHLVVDTSVVVLHYGDALLAPGAPTTFTFTVPSDPSLAGTVAIAQGAFLDTTAGRLALSSALVLALGGQNGRDR
jgi:hypothetical protein